MQDLQHGCQSVWCCGSFLRHGFVNKAARRIIQGLGESCRFGDREGRLPLDEEKRGLPPLPGCSTVEGYHCPACERISENLYSIRRHYNEKHGSRSGLTFRKVRAQHLFKGRFGVMFAVEPPEDREFDDHATSSEDIGQALQMEISQALHDEYGADWKGKDSWGYLKDVPWHSVLEAIHARFSVAELNTFITIPRIHTKEAQGTLARNLALAVEHMFKQAESGVRVVDDRLRQWLGSDTEG
jgi:hypothetical protein